MTQVDSSDFMGNVLPRRRIKALACPMTPEVYNTQMRYADNAAYFARFRS